MLLPHASTWGARFLLTPVGVEASSEFPADSTASYEASNLLDEDTDTAWFPQRQDLKPTVTFRFDRPVVLKALVIANGWNTDRNNWSANSRAKEFSVVLSDGTVFEEPLADEVLEQRINPFKENASNDRPTEWVRLELQSAYEGAEYPDMGLSEIRFLGRYARGDDDVVSSDLAGCTLTVLRDVVLPANETGVVLDEESQGVEGRRRRDWYVLRPFVIPKSVSRNDRVIGSGRSFKIVNVTEDRQLLALQFEASDGTLFGFKCEASGNRQYPSKVYGDFTMEEMNMLFEGILRFTDNRVRQTESY